MANGRRARLREQTMADLKRAALDEVREHGAVALSLRSVARRMGMSPAGLYRYISSREALLTLLITDSYAALARHVAAALGDGAPELPEVVLAAPERPATSPPVVADGDADVADRLRAVALAYRDWAVTHPEEFGLLFGDPIPGYAAPPGGPTVEAMSGFAFALAAPLLEAWREGRLRRLPAVPRSFRDRLDPLAIVASLADGDAPAELLALLLLAWGRLHGQISLEVFGHHAWAFPDGCEELFVADLEQMLRDLGVLGDGDEEGAS